MTGFLDFAPTSAVDKFFQCIYKAENKAQSSNFLLKIVSSLNVYVK